ncbi:hypothetical protein KGY79_13500 [Candidatus Bipolaricaulota bacterium]|nr:hypothetical protein [Candidatus Bipolaricaulota bacterium]
MPFKGDADLTRSAVNIFLVFSVTSLIVLVPFGQTVLASGFGTHSVVGGALGNRIAKTNFQAFVIGLLSHALLDYIPHHDPSTDDSFDVALYTGFNLGGLWTAKEIYQRTGEDSRFLWGTIGGIIPDLEHVFYFDRCVGGECPDKLYPSHNGTVSHHGDASKVQGYLTEAGLIGIGISIHF